MDKMSLGEGWAASAEGTGPPRQTILVYTRTRPSEKPAAEDEEDGAKLFCDASVPVEVIGVADPLDHSRADVSFIAGLIVDKFLYLRRL
jgi:hypothetical protein